jgi:hypothetical protein
VQILNNPSPHRRLSCRLQRLRRNGPGVSRKNLFTICLAECQTRALALLWPRCQAGWGDELGRRSKKKAPESPNVPIGGAEANENAAEAMELSGADESSVLLLDFKRHADSQLISPAHIKKRRSVAPPHQVVSDWV